MMKTMSRMPRCCMRRWPSETVALTPQLQTEEFYDPDFGDTHRQTQWQIIRQADDRVVLDVTSDYMLTVFAGSQNGAGRRHRLSLARPGL